MQYRELGRTGLVVSRLGLGTVKLGRNTDVKYPTSFELPSDDHVERLLEGAFAAGVRLFDTAPAYGRSEERLASFATRHRSDVVLCTKAGEFYENGRSVYAFDATSLRRSLESSLRRLQVEAVDILLLHSNGEDRVLLEETDAVETLEQVKREGKARAIGISAKTEAGVLDATRAMDVIMAPLSLRQPELDSALSRAHAAGVGVLAIKCLASGHVTGVDQSASAEDALRFVAEKPYVDCAVLGTLRLEHLRQATQWIGVGQPPASSV